MQAQSLIQVFLFTVIALLTFRVEAQRTDHFSGWAAVFSTIKINHSVAIHFDGQLRSSDEWQQVQTILIRPGINVRVAGNQIATCGYAFINHRRIINEIGGWGPEHRIWEQYVFNQSFSVSRHFTTLQHRLRFEQRFISKSVIHNDELKTDEYAFSQRLRYFTRCIFPLKPVNKFEKGTFVSLQNELMLNISNSSATNGKFFDQNRAYTSLGYRFSSSFDLEMGYMYQFISGKTGNTNNNVIQLAGYVRL